jgi:hypothetical protein
VCGPGRLLSVVVATPSGPLLLHTTHIPPGSSMARRRFMLEGVLAVVAAASPPGRSSARTSILPQLETVGGQIVTWAERVGPSGTPKMRGKWRGHPALRWDQAERGVMQGGTGKILIDAYRHLHGYGRQEFSCS